MARVVGKDVDSGPAPGELKARPLLDGARDTAPHDAKVLVDPVVRLSWLAYDLNAGIADPDINPLVVLGRSEGVRVVDALIVKEGTDDRTDG